MLLANETVAEEYYFNEIPFVYRTHEEPDSEKIESVFSMIRAGKIKVKKAKENVSPKEIQQVLKEIEGLECEPFFARLLLRSNRRNTRQTVLGTLDLQQDITATLLLQSEDIRIYRFIELLKKI